MAMVLNAPRQNRGRGTFPTCIENGRPTLCGTAVCWGYPRGRTTSGRLYIRPPTVACASAGKLGAREGRPYSPAVALAEAVYFV
jgi:hypothetical protein